MKMFSFHHYLRVNGGGTVFLDGSWHLAANRDGRAEYEAGPRVTGARYFDIDDIAAKGAANPKGLPHMAPPPALFAAAMDALGIADDDDVVVYGTEGCMATSRAYWTFRAMGHPPERVRLMQGSLAQWIDAGGPVETVPAVAIKADDLNVTATPRYGTARDAANVYNMDDVIEAVGGDGPRDVIIDARSAARFNAEAPEPRAGLRLGHMPGAVNLPFNKLLVEGDVSKFRMAEEMRDVFRTNGVDVDTEQKIVCSCGSGVTACVVATALEICGRDPSNTFVYDGSWAEWGGEEATPIV